MKTISVENAVAMIPDGASLMVGGFMGVGSPERVIDELVRQGKRNLTVIANDTALPGRGIGKLVTAGLLAKTVASHIGLNPETQQQMMSGKMAVDLVPQGTLIERIRAGGFGLGGVLTPTGVGTVVEEGKRRIEVDGKSYLLETALRADFALVHAFLADYFGQSLLRSHGTQFQSRDRHGGGQGHRHGGKHRAGGRHRARSRRDAGRARRLPRCQQVSAWTHRSSSPSA